MNLNLTRCFLYSNKLFPMTIKHIYEINNNNQLIITLPDTFKNKKKVLVTVDDLIDSKAFKLELLKQASNDPLFLSDIKEINDDFNHIDNEI